MAALRIKNEVHGRPEDRREVANLDTSEAVVKHPMKTVEEFDGWFIPRSAGLAVSEEHWIERSGRRDA